MSFRFKQFFIEDSKCAMKVGTDGVLLGAWTPIDRFSDRIQVESCLEGAKNTKYRILDVGTGSGLIARMLMQRCPEAVVEGIDIDKAAVEQARENGVNAFCSSLQEWQMVNGKCPDGTLYDLIVSNPPYFQNSLKNPDKGRELARHTDSLPFEELIKHSTRLLRKEGQVALILPAEAEEEIRMIAARYSLYCTRVTRVYSKVGKPARRVLMAFERVQSTEYRIQTELPFQDDVLVLEDEKGGRSAAYSELTKDFYL